jgi:hypothetical protein
MQDAAMSARGVAVGVAGVAVCGVVPAMCMVRMSGVAASAV